MNKRNVVLGFASILIMVSFLVSCGNNQKNNQNTSNTDSNKVISTTLEGNITISGAFALYPMVVKWKEEFVKLYPNVKIDVSAGGAGKGMTDALAGLVDMGMVSREISAEEQSKGVWFIPVAKDAVVPVISDNNPEIEKLLNDGLSKEMFQEIFITGKIKTWGQLCNNKTDKNQIKVYTRSDACGAADVWAKYLGKKQEDLLGVGVSGDPGITQAVQSDNFGIGYNNICYAYDATTKLEAKGIRVLPIDINGNGIIDDKEFFYHHKDSIIQAISDGRYPSPPARDLYLVTKGKPTKEIVITFLKWILTDGQKYVNETGYIKLTSDKMNAANDKLK